MKNKKILILEDELLTSRFIKETLQVLGAKVTGEFDNAEDALLSLKETKPDIALVDIVLAGEMSGLEAAEIFYQKYDIPVVFLTAYSDEYTIRNAMKSEPFAYLLKPIDQKELRINIEMALYKHKLMNKIKESKLWLETTLNCIADGVIALNKDGKINFINETAQKITGWDANRAIGKDLMEVYNIVEYEKTYKDSIEEKFPDDKLYRSSQCVINIKTEKETLIESTDAAIINEHGIMYGVVIVFRKLEEINTLINKTDLELIKNRNYK